MLWKLEIEMQISAYQNSIEFVGINVLDMMISASQNIIVPQISWDKSLNWNEYKREVRYEFRPISSYPNKTKKSFFEVEVIFNLWCFNWMFAIDTWITDVVPRSDDTTFRRFWRRFAIRFELRQTINEAQSLRFTRPPEKEMSALEQANN